MTMWIRPHVLWSLTLIYEICLSCEYLVCDSARELTLSLSATLTEFFFGQCRLRSDCTKTCSLILYLHCPIRRYFFPQKVLKKSIFGFLLSATKFHLKLMYLVVDEGKGKAVVFPFCLFGQSTSVHLSLSRTVSRQEKKTFTKIMLLANK